MLKLKMSKDGYTNEKKISQELNNKKFTQLSDNFKKVVKFIDKNTNESTLIFSHIENSNSKSDLKIKINNSEFRVSIKKGSGNSIHQEPIEKFIKFIKTKLNASDKICDFLRLYIWGDGTLDGQGLKKDRVSANKFKQIYPEIITQIQDFFEQNKDTLIKRFLVEGGENKNPAEYIYYGDENKGKIICSTDAVNYLKNLKLKNRPHIGGLSFQAWNRNLNGGSKSENKRGQIQIKWTNLSKDIDNI